ncbi:putative Glycosyl hydrolase family 35 protein [Cucumis melo var. makuwa]|nr:putative Glycosyl hydrolase family 35 protein [Cucumis melo var. makuwa]TYK20155.1 putative Glycosyl hydrolase family 35 protein [Cucumis melo var. makuwa]
MAANNLHVESNEYLFATPSNRKMKLQDSEQRNPTRKNVRVGDVNLYDYHPIDPVPSSKRSIKHGPIEHGSPLIPHMPNPSPPDQPQPGGFV